MRQALYVGILDCHGRTTEHSSAADLVSSIAHWVRIVQFMVSRSELCRIVLGRSLSQV